MLKRDKGTNLFATNKPPAQLFSPRGRRKVAHSELFSYLCATQVPGRGAARAHSSVGQSSGLIIRRSWDHAPLGPPDKPEHPSRRMPRLLFCPAGKGLPSACSAPSTRQEFPRPHNRLAQHARRESLPSARHVHWKLLLARTTRPPGTSPTGTTRPPGTSPRPHNTQISPSRTTRPRPHRTVRTPPKVVSPPLFAVSPTARTLRFRNNLVPFGIFRIFDVV